MPKSAKKRKAKAADFTKSKLKLGKGKQLASNAIDTSFKARSIALPSQSITKDKDTEIPTTKRRLTFDELVAHSKHYSAGTRKDAILGFRELLDAHPELLQPSLPTLLAACARMIGDEDSSVRKVLLAFFNWLLPRIPKDQLAPHAPSLLLFTTSAQTHIFPEIRIDAVRFIDLLLEHTPESIVAGWNESGNHPGRRVLEGYLGLLNAGTKYGESDGPLKATSTASVVLTPGSKLAVLKSLSSFLRHAIASTKNSNSPRWYFASSFSSPEAYNAFDDVLKPATRNTSRRPFTSRQWTEEYEDEIGNEDFALQQDAAASTSTGFLQSNTLYLTDLLGVSDTDAGSSTVDPNFMTHLAHVLHSTLVSTFLDCSAAVFSPSGNPPDTELQLILAVGEIARAVYGEILQNQNQRDSKGKGHSSLDELSGLLGHMITYFPFSAGGGRREMKIEQALQDLNIIYCELSSLLLSAEQDGQVTRSRNGSSVRIGAVQTYVLQALGQENASAVQTTRLLTSTAYTSLLPTIWTLINANKHQLNDVLNAAISHAVSISAKSALKRPAIDFICRLILLDTDPFYRGHVRLGRHASSTTPEGFAEELPKTLWELGGGNPELSEVILRFLLRFLQRTCKTGSKLSVSIRSRFMPYFTITHPTRGTVPGPYSKLPKASPVRRLALDVGASLVVPAGVDGNGLNDAINSVLVSCPEEQAYWTSITCETRQ